MEWEPDAKLKKQPHQLLQLILLLQPHLHTFHVKLLLVQWVAIHSQDISIRPPHLAPKQPLLLLSMPIRLLMFLLVSLVPISIHSTLLNGQQQLHSLISQIVQV